MRSVPALALVLNLVVCFWALTKGFYIEPTTAALAESAQGQRMALLAVPGAIVAVVGLVRRRWSLPAGIASVLLGLGAVLIAVV